MFYRRRMLNILAYAQEENLEAVAVAEVTEEKRLVMYWRGKEIVNLSRAFLDTNGAHQEQPHRCPYAERRRLLLCKTGRNYRCEENMAGNTVRSERLLKKGLVEMFDSSIGAGTVAMPFGGKTQLTPIQTMTAKLPVLEGKTDLATMMSYGFDPNVST